MLRSWWGAAIAAAQSSVAKPSAACQARKSVVLLHHVGFLPLTCEMVISADASPFFSLGLPGSLSCCHC